jgi:hypothetical protein
VNVPCARWRDLISMPMLDELHGDEFSWRECLQKTQDTYESLEHYLEVYYTLLRAETFMLLSEGVRSLHDTPLRPEVLVARPACLTPSTGVHLR